MKNGHKEDATIAYPEGVMSITSSDDLLRLLDFSPDALVIISQTGHIVLASTQLGALFGYTRSELLRSKLEKLLPQRFRQDHVRHRRKYFSSSSMRPMGAGLRLFGLRKDGSEFPVDISLRPILLDNKIHALAAVRDMTTQHLAEQARLQQAQHIRLQAELINQSHDAILVRDPINRILSWNQGAERLYGWQQQDVLGRVTHNLLKTSATVSLSQIDAQLTEQG